MSDNKPEEQSAPIVSSAVSTSDEQTFDTYEQSEAIKNSEFSDMAFDQDPKVDFAPLLLSESLTRDDMQYKCLFGINEESKYVTTLKEVDKKLDRELIESIGGHRAIWLSKEFNKLMDASFEPWLQTRLLKIIPDSDPEYKQKRVAMIKWFNRKICFLLDMKVIFDLSKHGVMPMTKEEE